MRRCSSQVKNAQLQSAALLRAISQANLNFLGDCICVTGTFSNNFNYFKASSTSRFQVLQGFNFAATHALGKFLKQIFSSMPSFFKSLEISKTSLSYSANLRKFTIDLIILALGYFTYRSSHLRCFVNKGVLKSFAKFTGKHLCQSLFFNKAAGLSPAT